MEECPPIPPARGVIPYLSLLVGQAILPAGCPLGPLSSASKPAGKPACSQDWLPHKPIRASPSAG